jgi:hypothetical protein
MWKAGLKETGQTADCRDCGVNRRGRRPPLRGTFRPSKVGTWGKCHACSPALIDGIVNNGIKITFRGSTKAERPNGTP